MQSLSIVIPIKDERENLRRLHERLTDALDPLGRDYELLLIDDGSTDGSFAVMVELAERDARVKVISFRRNYGQTPALQAGIDWAAGDIIVTMDGDLQNDPADIPMLIEKLEEGYDAVFGLREKRRDAFFLRKIPSWLGNWLIRKVTGCSIKDMGCTLRAMKRDLAKSLPLYGELHRFIPVLAHQTGAKVLQVPVRHYPRTAGQTKYTISRTFRVVLDLITVKFLHSYVTRPMHAFGQLGLGMMVFGFLSLLTTVYMKLGQGIDMTGNPMLLLTVLFVLVGVQFISMGLISELLTRTYHESQGKSSYQVKTTLNLEDDFDRRAA
jgi:glycosyltransferase involved in cell wall biosynthesis